MEATGIGWAGWIGIAGGIAGVLSCIIGLVIWLAPSRRDIVDDITNDPTYRRDLATDLVSNSLGQHYHRRLEGGLALLDRTFGPPSSAAALGICIIIALIYAFAGFALVWGAGGPGVIVNYRGLPEDTDQPGRIVAAALAIALPTGFFWLGRWLGPLSSRFERQMLMRLQRARRRLNLRAKRRTVERVYRLVIVAALLVLLTVNMPERAIGVLSLELFFGAWPVLSVVVGTQVWPMLRSESDWTRALASSIAAAFAVTFSVAIVVFLDFPLGSAGLLAEPGAIALAIGVAIAGVGAIAGALVGGFAFHVVSAGFGAGAATLAFAGTPAGSVAVLISGAVGLFWKPGAIPGALGGIVGVAGLAAVFITGFDKGIALLYSIFFLVLPLINGVVDWLSWWVTRWLGVHLRRSFGPGATARRVSSLAIAHGVADLLLAALMLLAMAFTLAFGFEAYNQASLWQGGRQAFDLETFVAQAAAAPFSDGAWLTLMLLTTLVPTFLHVAVVCMSPLGFLFLSARRHEWAKNLEAWDTLDEPTQSRTRRAVAGWMAHGRILLWLLAGLMALGLFALIATAIALLHDGGFADYVADAAFLGINLARWLAGN